MGLWFMLLSFVFGGLFWGKGGRVLSALQTDFSDYFLPMSNFGFSQMWKGIIPLWSPYTFSGQPFVANFESALFYPPNWIHLFIPSSIAFNFLAVFHVFLAGFGFYLWARSWKLDYPAAWVSSVAFMLGGAFLPRLYAGQISNFYSSCWAPFIFWSLERMRSEFSLGVWMATVFGISMQILAGHPQYAFYTLMTLVIYIAFGPGGVAGKLKMLGRLFTAYLAALGLDSIQVLTGLGALTHCRRSIPLSTKAAAYNSLSPVYLLTLGMQYVFGRDFSSPSPWPLIPYWGEDFWENNLFLGGAACWLAFFALFIRTRKSLQPFGLTALAVALLSLGSYFPLYPFLLKFIPFFDRFRGTNKFGFLVVMMMALLCGMGLDELLRSIKPRRRDLVGIVLLGGLFCLGGFYWFFSARQGPGGTWWNLFQDINSRTQFLEKNIRPGDQVFFVRLLGFNFSACWILTGVEGLALAILFYLAHCKKNLVFFICAYVIASSVFFAKTNYRDFPLASQEAKIKAMRASLGEKNGNSRVLLHYGETMVPFGKDAWGVNTFAISRYALFLAKSQGLKPEEVMNQFNLIQPNVSQLGLLRISRYMRDEGDRLKSVHLLVPEVPRFLWFNRWKKVPNGQEALDAIFAPRFNPQKEIVLERDPVPTPSFGPPGLIRIKDISTNTIEFQIQTAHPSILFVGENFFPGWKIHNLSLNPPQTKYEILTADYFLRAVPLAAGVHHFQMRYEPVAFRLGLWISLVFSAFFSVLSFQGLTRLFSSNFSKISGGGKN